MSKLFLKVKIKSLAAEARIIRHEEEKRKAPIVSSPRPTTVTTPRFPNDPSRSIQWHLRYRRKYPLKEGDVYFSLHHHRTVDIRFESRAAQLAYAFIRHRPYRSVESSRKNAGLPADVLMRIAELVAKYGDTGKSKNDLYVIVFGWMKE